MNKKGLDSLFVHYGIRKDDMTIIEQLCERHDIVVVGENCCCG